MPAEILILGGGYAGLAAAGTLARLRRRGADVRVRLIDRNACSVASPMLPDLISGRVGPDRLRHPLGPHCRRLGVEFVRADVREISVTDRQAATDRGSFRADGMIFCLGCENNYFGDEQMRARAPGLKSIAEALAIRSAAERLVDRARGDAGWRPAHLVVVGGGYTGFETASHLADLARRRVGGSFRRLRRFVRVLVVEKGDSVLRNVSPEVRLWAVRLMRAYGLEVRTGVTVASLEPPRAVALTDGTVLDGAMVVWTAGVSPGPACAALSAPGSRAGRLTVDDRLRLAGAERVFAAGDVAGAVRPGTGQPPADTPPKTPSAPFRAGP